MSKTNKTATRLLRKNVIVFNGKVTGKMLRHAIEYLTILESRGSPDIEVRIFSGGGSIIAGLGIYDALRRYKGKKTGVVYVFAMSMGAIILQACDDRVCLPHSTILIHNPSLGAGSVSLEDFADLKKAGDSLQLDKEALDKIIADRTGKSKKEIRKACSKEQEMSAKDALAFGLIDRIEGE